MANAVRTGPLSRNYQHRYFWIQACRLFHQRNLVRRVAIEKVELRAFDDVSAFYGESMFSRVRDASKAAQVHLVEHIRNRRYTLLDIQQLTPHTARLGAVAIPRVEYLARLTKAIDLPVRF